VTVVTRTMAARYGERFPQRAADIEGLYNGFDPEDLTEATLRREGSFTVAYIGSFHPRSPPTTLLTAVARLRDAGRATPDRLQVEIVGRPEAAIRRSIQRLGLSDIVRVRGFRPLREAVETAARADLLYLLIPLRFRGALSDKLFTHLATGNPILAEVPGGE